MNKEQQTPKAKETPAPMPEVWIGPATKNLFLIRDGFVVYVKIVTPACKLTGHVYKIGPDLPISGYSGRRQVYTGPIDDETLANILIYG